MQAGEGLEVLAPADRRVLARVTPRLALGEPAAARSRDGRFVAHVYRRTEVAFARRDRRDPGAGGR